MNYLKLYHKMIEKTLPRTGKKLHCQPLWERHHIRPQALNGKGLGKEFPQKAGGNRTTVFLTVREHRLIHKVFYKAMVQLDSKHANLFAGDNYSGSSRVIADARTEGSIKTLRTNYDNMIVRNKDLSFKIKQLENLNRTYSKLDKLSEEDEVKMKEEIEVLTTDINALKDKNNTLAIEVWEVKADAFDIINYNFKNKQ